MRDSVWFDGGDRCNGKGPNDRARHFVLDIDWSREVAGHARHER